VFRTKNFHSVSLTEEGPAHLDDQPVYTLTQSGGDSSTTPQDVTIGVAFMGRPAPGGHNIVWGLVEAAAQMGGRVIGFKFGSRGLFNNDTVLLTPENISAFKNQGGFDMLGRSSDAVTKDDSFDPALNTIRANGLSALVLVGGPRTVYNGELLTNAIKEAGLSTRVIIAPCTMDGDLPAPLIETTTGFDTVTKTFAETVGNIERDAISAVKYYFLVRLMGRENSHVTLETALQSRPNATVFSEFVGQKRVSLRALVQMMADQIQARAKNKKKYGVILIPEGLPSELSELRNLIEELNTVTSEGLLSVEKVCPSLTPWSAAVLRSLPEQVSRELLNYREGQEKIQYSQISTEKLLATMITQELADRNVKFAPICTFLGYQGRSSLPSNFDCTLGFTLGQACAVLASKLPEATGYVASVQGLANANPANWLPIAAPIHGILGQGQRRGASGDIPAVPVAAGGAAFSAFNHQSEAERWDSGDAYCNVGPLQLPGAGDHEVFAPMYVNLRAHVCGFDNHVSKHKQLRYNLARVADLSRAGCQNSQLSISSSLVETVVRSLEVFGQRGVLAPGVAFSSQATSK
jgi:pyrophosphate--fructose-6-phosphate 1-phosphotransferase